MKTKTALIFIIAGTVFFTIGVYLYSIMGDINNLEIGIIALILVLVCVSIIIGVRRMKEEKQGFPPEDELSLLIKYKGGYYAYIVSMYLWFFIFLFKDIFPDTETMLGVGILGSAFIFFLTYQYAKRQINAKSN